MRSVKKGATDQSVIVRVVDSTDGTPETGVAYNTAGVDLWYRREGGAKTSITEATLAAVDSAHSDGGFIHIGDGYCRLDLPDAAFATGANGVMVGGTFTGMVVIGCYVPLVDYDPQDTVRLGLTALPNAAADAAGGLPISDAGGLDLDAQKADVAAILVDTGTTLQGELDGIQADTEDIQTRLPAALVSGRMDSSVGAMAANVITAAATAADFGTEIAAAVWNALTSGMSTAGSIGKKLADWTIHSAADVWSVATRVLTANTNLNDLNAAGVRAAVGLANADLDTQLAALPTAGENADQVWEEAIADHSGTVGSTAEQLAAAGAAGDPWDTTIPGAYGAGKAGKIVGDALSGHTPQTGDAYGIVNSGTHGNAALKTLIDAIDDYIDTEVAAIKAKTDNLPAAPAATGDIPTANANADALLDRATAIEGYTPRQLFRLFAAVLIGKCSGAGTGTEVFRDIADTKARVTATVDGNNNRTAITRDAT